MNELVRDFHIFSEEGSDPNDKEYVGNIKEALTNQDLNPYVFNVLLRVLIAHKDVKTKEFVKKLLIKNVDLPKILIPICSAIDALDIQDCSLYLEKILDKYYYDDFIQNKDKTNYKNTDNIGLMSQVIFLLGKFRFKSVSDKLQNLGRYLKFSEPLIGKTAEEALKKMKRK